MGGGNTTITLGSYQKADYNCDKATNLSEPLGIAKTLKKYNLRLQFCITVTGFTSNRVVCIYSISNLYNNYSLEAYLWIGGSLYDFRVLNSSPQRTD